MGYQQMTTAEVYGFLSSPVRPAVLTTVRADGRPHAAPIWFALDGHDLLFNTGADTVKGRNLAARPHVALLVQDDRPPYSFAMVEGTAVLSDDLVRRLGAIGLTLQDRFGGRPQDIEWLVVGGRIMIVQSRDYVKGD